jgi:hypothetical protein
VLCAPVVAFALGLGRGADIENRALTPVPPLTIGTFLHRGRWEQAASAFSDRLPLRNQAIRLNAGAAFDVFGDTPAPYAIIRGRNNWLFLVDDFTACLNYVQTSPMRVAQAFELAYAAVTASGRVFRVMLIPNKSTVELEHYRSAPYSFEACARSRERQLRQLLRGQPGIVDLWGPFEAMKHAGKDVWLKNDSHVDTPGDIVIARALVKSLDASAWQNGLEQAGLRKSYVGDLSIISGITLATRHPELRVHGSPKHPIQAIAIGLVDSQIAQAYPTLQPYMPHLSLIGFDAVLDQSLVPESALRTAHVFIAESVQRTAFRRVALGFPDALVDTVLPDLHTRAASYTSPGPLKAPGGQTGTGLRLPTDACGCWRLVVVRVLRADGGTINLYLVQPGHILDAPDTLRQGVAVGTTATLAIPPGVSSAGLGIYATGPNGFVLSPPRVVYLPTSR